MEKALRDEQKKLEQGLQNLEVEIKREARRLQRFCGEIQELEPEELLIPVQEAANTAQKAYAVFTGDEKGLFARPVELFETGQQAAAELSDAVRSAAHKTEDRIAELKKQADQKSAVLANLRRNIKDYPHGLLLFKDRLEKDLADKTGHAVPVYILADVLEMADERWRGAVEGYLNNQKYYLLVEPGRYQDALNIYDRLKQEAEYRAFGLVDIGKLREKETLRPLPGSLAEKVETENNICEAGDHFVCSSTIYGGTFNLYTVTLKKLGIDVTLIDPDDDESTIEAAFRPNTKALFGETLSNPGMHVLDIEKFARIAHASRCCGR